MLAEGERGTGDGRAEASPIEPLSSLSQGCSRMHEQMCVKQTVSYSTLTWRQMTRSRCQFPLGHCAFNHTLSYQA